MADIVWDLERYYWPREGVMRWWQQGWDWESLRSKKCLHPDYATYGDYYAPVFKFSDPRPDYINTSYGNYVELAFKSDGPLSEITEEEYWGSRWFTEFVGKRWTPYHLPLFDPETGKLSPKHPDYRDAGRWSDADHEAFVRGLKARMRAGNEVKGRKLREPDWRAQLSGVVIPPSKDICLPDETVHVDFSDALFGHSCRFIGDARSTAFGPNTSFARALFGNDINFTGAQFGNSTSFAATRFGDYAHFEGTQFGELAIFILVQFSGDAYFGGARFGAGAMFDDARFGRSASFVDVQFGEVTIFDRAQFLSNAEFFLSTGPRVETPATLSANIEFGENRSATLAFRRISFAKVEFRSDADFSNRHFTGKIDFSDAKFYGVVAFHGSVLHENTLLPVEKGFLAAPGECFPWELRPERKLETGLAKDDGSFARRILGGMSDLKRALDEWLDRSQHIHRFRRKRQIKRVLLSEDKTGNAWNNRCKEFEQAYRRLKLLMQQQGARNEEQAFYALEIRSRIQRRDIPLFEKLFAWLYGLTSDYGQSVMRPFGGLGATAILFGALLVWLSFASGHGYSFDNVASYLARNLVPGLLVRDLTQGSSSPYQVWVDALLKAYGAGFYLLATLHAIFNLILWFLFALALRRRFQIS